MERYGVFFPLQLDLGDVRGRSYNLQVSKVTATPPGESSQRRKMVDRILKSRYWQVSKVDTFQE